MKTSRSTIATTIALALALTGTVITASAKDKVAIAVDSSSFSEKVIKNKGVVLVDFWATWCPPCVALAPTIEDIAQDYKSRVVVAKVDVDKAADVAEANRIEAMPTLIIFKDGKEVDRIVGAVPKKVITAKLDSALGK